MQKRKLGNQGLEVSKIGLGCMGLTWAYGRTDEKESLRVLERSLELGINFFDTAEIYGPYNNEELIGRFIKGKQRKDLIIATKFGFKISPDKEIEAGVDSRPNHIRKSIEGSLKRLGTDYIDLYYQHRLDPNTPIEDTVGEMAKLVKEGKVRYLGLSEVGPSIIRRAHAIHPITALQTEYSLWEKGVEETILPALRELGIGFVAYSPLGRGFLTGKIQVTQNFEETDFRRNYLPRFSVENAKHNYELVKKVQEIASTYQTTPAQIALAWLFRQGNDIVPIPGTKRVHYLEENVHSVDLELPESAWISLEKTLASFKPAGPRYAEDSMMLIHNT